MNIDINFSGFFFFAWLILHEIADFQNFVQNTTFGILQEILRSHPFLTSRKFKAQGCKWYGNKRIKYIFANKGNCGARLGAPFYFFNKPDLERYLFKCSHLFCMKRLKLEDLFGDDEITRSGSA